MIFNEADCYISACPGRDSPRAQYPGTGTISLAQLLSPACPNSTLQQCERPDRQTPDADRDCEDHQLSHERIPYLEGQGADLLERRVWDGLSERVIVASYSASRSLRTAAI